jgi:hypothetical protein
MKILKRIFVIIGIMILGSISILLFPIENIFFGKEEPWIVRLDNKYNII